MNALWRKQVWSWTYKLQLARCSEWSTEQVACEYLGLEVNESSYLFAGLWPTFWWSAVGLAPPVWSAENHAVPDAKSAIAILKWIADHGALPKGE